MFERLLKDLGLGDWSGWLRWGWIALPLAVWLWGLLRRWLARPTYELPDDDTPIEPG
jgi:hypothetical protein